MTLSKRARPRSSPVLRWAVLVALSLAVLQLGLGPVFSVKGAWEGGLADVATLPRGLESTLAGGFTFNEKGSGASVIVEDGRMNLHYADGPLSLSMDDGSEWQANITEEGLRLRARGSGSDDIKWEATKQSKVEGLGDVVVDVNSERDVGVSVSPSLPDIAGTKLKVLARSRGDELYGRLEAHRKLANMDLTYSVENADGDYDLANLEHAAKLVGTLGDGTMVVQLANQGGTPSYNATYAHDLSRALRGDSDMVVGVDNDGVYGTFAKSHAMGKGVTAGYKFAGHTPIDDMDPEFVHSAELLHPHGSLKLSQASGEPVEALVRSDIASGANRVQGELGYTLGEAQPTFNLSLSSDLQNALSKLEADGEVVVGIDGASPGNVYGKVAASRKLGKGFGVHYASAGRLGDVEHALTLANDLGYGQLVKRGDDDPRLRLGYQFSA